MIGRLAGTLLEKNPPQIVVEAGGVGYEVEVPMSTFYNLPASGERVMLLTHLIVREDAHLLYGFGSEAERRAFRQLLKISGVGARTALAVLSGLSVAELIEAVAMQESGRLVKIPGIGRKTAERLFRRWSRDQPAQARGERRHERAPCARLQRQGSAARGETNARRALGLRWHPPGAEVARQKLTSRAPDSGHAAGLPLNVFCDQTTQLL